MNVAQWIAIDWGTSNTRLWGMGADGKALFTAQSERGMSRLSPADYPDALQALLAGQPVQPGPLQVIVCGMAGAKQGWREAPYLKTPADLSRLGSGAVSFEVGEKDWRVHIVPGVCQDAPEDVMRGEETQLLGLLTLKPDFSGLVCMPGTHAKWARIENGVLTRFATSMTGELYEILSLHSVLRHSVKVQTDQVSNLDESSCHDKQTARADGAENQAGLAEGLQHGISHPHLLVSALFRARAASLLSNKSADWCAGYLSGLLIGADCAAHRDWCAGTDAIPLIGSARLCLIYARALAMIGLECETLDASASTLFGLAQARKQITHV